MRGVPEALPFPALLGSQAASAGRRVGRWLLLVVMTATAAGLTALLLLVVPVPQAAGQLPLGLGIAAALVVLGNGVALAATGRSVPDRMLGLRHVRTNGNVPGMAGIGRALLTTLLGIATLGLVPLVLFLATRDGSGRCWYDRVTGLTVLDIRRGRDVVRHPVRRAEIEAFLNPPRPPGPPVVPVRGVVARPSAGATQGVPLPGPRPQPEYQLRFHDGSLRTLRGTALLGRLPEVVPADPSVMLVQVGDPRLTVSKTHLKLVAEARGVWAEDLGSTNGSALVGTGGADIPLVVGTPLLAAEGSTVRFGECTVTIEPGRPS